MPLDSISDQVSAVVPSVRFLAKCDLVPFYDLWRVAYAALPNANKHFLVEPTAARLAESFEGAGVALGIKVAGQLQSAVLFRLESANRKVADGLSLPKNFYDRYGKIGVFSSLVRLPDATGPRLAPDVLAACQVLASEGGATALACKTAEENIPARVLFGRSKLTMAETVERHDGRMRVIYLQELVRQSSQSVMQAAAN